MSCENLVDLLGETAANKVFRDGRDRLVSFATPSECRMSRRAQQKGEREYSSLVQWQRSETAPFSKHIGCARVFSTSWDVVQPSEQPLKVQDAVLLELFARTFYPTHRHTNIGRFVHRLGNE